MHHHEGEDSLNSNHESEELYNPHIWLDPYLVYTYIIPGLVEDLSKLDPKNSFFYSQNGDYLTNRMVKLDNYLNEKSKQVHGDILWYIIHLIILQKGIILKLLLLWSQHQVFLLHLKK